MSYPFLPNGSADRRVNPRAKFSIKLQEVSGFEIWCNNLKASLPLIVMEVDSD